MSGKEGMGEQRLLNWRAWWEELLNIVFPTSNFCLFCWKEYNGAAEGGACPQCTESLLNFSQTGAVCPRCGRFTIAENCPNCQGLGIPGLAGVVSVVPYEGQYREIIQQLKYGGKQELGQLLGFLMARRLQQAYPLFKPDFIIPVPLEPHRQLARGFNQSVLLAASVSSIIRRPVVEDYLFRGTGKASQSTLSRAERIANTRDAFYLRDDGALMNRVILLVDDIITTGATLAACAQALHSGGAKEVLGLTWAAGIRQNIANTKGTTGKISKTQK